MKPLDLTHRIDDTGNVIPITDNAGDPRWDLQWELERWQRNLSATKADVAYLKWMQALWGIIMVAISTASLAVLLYAVLE